MAKTLVIAEKPSVGRDIAAALPDRFSSSAGVLEGADYVISWAIGHLLTLADPDAYDAALKRWSFSDLPILPDAFKLKPAGKRGREQLAVLKGLIGRSDIDCVVNACDAGREGELIFAYIWQATAKSKRAGKTVKRLWLSALTKQAITDAFADLRPASDYAPLEDAARSRAEADWLVGINATRAATLRLGPGFDGVVSIGRVQTPTLAILARREEEIDAFTPEDYWTIAADFTAAAGDYRGRYRNGHRFGTAAEAETIRSACLQRPARISGLQVSDGAELPPLLYDLTALQRHAGAAYGFSAKRTLALAQSLYEQHKALTYPRTSSRYLNAALRDELPAIVARVGAAANDYRQAAAYLADLAELPSARIIDDAKVTDHHAIIPTTAAHDLSAMSADERKIYDLVARRFLCSFYPDARYRRSAVETTITAADGTEHIFNSSGKIYLEQGWRVAYAGTGLLDDGSVAELPALVDGEDVTTKGVTTAAKQTKPPRRYSDASLLGAMETAGRLCDDDAAREAMKESGLGTPATRAQVIERLITVEYVERDGKSFAVTTKGRGLIAALGSHPLTSPELTGSWEKRLLGIERGGEGRQQFMSDIGAFTTATVAALRALPAPTPAGAIEHGPCPGCGRTLVENRKAISCWRRDDPGCGFALWKRIAGKKLPKWAITELLTDGKTSKPVSGFKGRSGKTFNARLELVGSPAAVTRDDGGDDAGSGGSWRVGFAEDWARKQS